jgi:hypothetical protein
LYGLNICDKFGIGSPGHVISANGQISSTGAVALSWSGNLALFHSRLAAGPFVATTEMNLFVPALLEGLLDFSKAASISLDLPAGYTAKTSSGLPLFVNVTPPATVPVPAALGLMMSGLAPLSIGALRGRNAV